MAHWEGSIVLYRGTRCNPRVGCVSDNSTTIAEFRDLLVSSSISVPRNLSHHHDHPEGAPHRRFASFICPRPREHPKGPQKSRIGQRMGSTISKHRSTVSPKPNVSHCNRVGGKPLQREILHSFTMLDSSKIAVFISSRPTHLSERKWTEPQIFDHGDNN